MGIDSMVYEAEGNVKVLGNNYREDCFKKLAEVAYLILDVGCIVIAVVDNLTSNDLNIIKTIVDSRKIRTIWIGKNSNKEIDFDFHIPISSLENKVYAKVYAIVENYLKDEGIIFSSW